MLILVIRSHRKIANNTNPRDSTVGNRQILQWDLMTKINIMLIHTSRSAPKRFAKFGWKTQTFCPRKVEKAVAKLESDRL